MAVSKTACEPAQLANKDRLESAGGEDPSLNILTTRKEKISDRRKLKFVFIFVFLFVEIT